MEAVYSVRSVLRLYKENQLPLWNSLDTAVRRVRGGVRRPLDCEDVRPEVEERPLLEAATYQRDWEH
jgi:hypothetical protein